MKHKRFPDYTVLVTGASSGIGAATAQAFAREGARVVLIGRRADRLHDLARRIATFNSFVLALPTDIRDEDAVRDMVRQVLARFGRIEILINNAGVLYAGPAAELASASVNAMFQTNVFGLLHCVRAVTPSMRERGYGHIVNISSVAGHVAVPPLGVYAATKHAVEALSSALRVELASSGIHVTTICPGPVATELGRIHGRHSSARPSLLQVSSAHTAACILTAVHGRRREMFVPGIMSLAPTINLIAPDLLARVGHAIRQIRHRR